MDTNRNTYTKILVNEAGTCTSQQGKDTKYRSESTCSYWQLVGCNFLHTELLHVHLTGFIWFRPDFPY